MRPFRCECFDEEKRGEHREFCSSVCPSSPSANASNSRSVHSAQPSGLFAQSITKNQLDRNNDRGRNRTGWIKATAWSARRRSVRMRRTAKGMMSRAGKTHRVRIPIHNITESRILILTNSAIDKSGMGRLPCARRVPCHANWRRPRTGLLNAVFDANEEVRLRECN